MSALPPEADMLIVGINVCYVPLADITCLGEMRFGDRGLKGIPTEKRKPPELVRSGRLS